MIQFIRMLQTVMKAEYQTGVPPNAEKYIQKLKEQPPIYRGLLSELEVIPYEQLWTVVLKLLK